MTFIYVKSEPGLWTVGAYGPDGWSAESDHDSQEKAATRTAWLNGSRTEPEPTDARTLVEMVAPVTTLVDVLRVGGVEVIDPTRPILLQPGERLRVIVDRPGWGKPERK